MILKQYIREKAPDFLLDEYGNKYKRMGKTRRIGVLISTGPGKIGFSLISPYENLKKRVPEDVEIKVHKDGKDSTLKVKTYKRVWDQKKIWEFGTQLATERANDMSKNPEVLNDHIKKQIDQFEKRVERFYSNGCHNCGSCTCKG